MAFEAPFRLEINHENNKLSFGPRRPNEVGRDILAVKVALGLVEIRNETEQELEQTSSPPVGTSAPLDKQGWFDCATGEGISIAQASTYDSRLRKSLINYQIQNQFLIISYLIEKFGIREALGAVPRDLEFDQNNDNLPKEYSRSLIQQIESSVILFDSELGLLGEATLAVLHGWVPHSTITNSGYAHIGFDNYETIVDIIHTALANDLENENFGQSYDDMVNQGICVEGGFSRNEESKLNTYLEYASNEINWTRMVGEYNPFVTNREIQRFQFGILEFVKKDPLTTQSLLYSATIATLDNQLKDLDQEESISYAMSSEQRIENLKRMYFPDPFVDPDPFEIDDDRIGHFLETDFELKPGSLPNSDEETIQSLEQLALEEVFKYYQKPEIWFLNKSARPARDMPDNEIEKIQVTYFGGSTPPDSEHNGYYPFPVSLREKNNFDPDTEFSKYEAYSNLQYRLQFNKDQYRTRLKRWEITDIISGLLDGQEGAPNLYYELTGDVKTVSYRMSQDDEKELYERVIEEIEQKLAVWPEPNESKELFWVLSLKPNTSESYTQYWRDLENIGSTEPLIKFIEYRTPSLRPGQKYRALFYINKEKLDLIKDSVLLDTQRTSTRAPSVNTEEDDSCGDTSTQQNIRKYQEYKTHAIRTRNEIVKKFREETKKAKYQNDFDSMSIDLGDQQLAFNLNDAFNPFGGGMVSGKAYTEKVFSKLIGEDSSLLSAIGVVGSDTAQLDSIINTTDPLKVESNNMPDGTITETEENANKIRLTLEDLKVRVKIMSQDLKDAGKEIKKGGIKFAPGSAFNADREANYVNAFVSELEASMKEQGFKVSDEIVITFEFDRAVNNAKVGPKIGKSVIYLGLSIPMKVDPSETGRTKKSSTVSNKKETYDDTQMAHFRAPASKFKNLTRPRTVNYISRIFDMTTRYLPEGSIMKSFFEDSRGACKDLGIDIKKTLGVSYIGKYTSGLQLIPSKEQTNYEAVKEWWKTQATDPYNDWVNTSANNLRASDPNNPENDFFDESQALAMMGEMCEWEDVYKALFDKLDFASLLCDYIKCIKLPGFNIKLPSFYLPPLPKVPFIGWMGEVYKFLVENFKEIVNRLLCTAAKLLIDKMAIPFCEEQLREFISAGSSAGPLWNEAMADALLLTGITSGNAEQAKNFFEDSVAILTGDELCRLLKGERLDAATTRAIIKLVQNRGLEMELETAEDLSNFFGVLGAYLPTDLCEAIGNLPEIVAKDCEDSIDVLNDIRNKLLSDDPNISEEDLNAALEIAKKNRDDIANQLKSFSNSDLGDLAPSFFEMGNPSAMVSDYPPYLKQQMNDALSSVFEPARSSYISSLTNFIPAMRINMPESPRPGDEDYDETTIMQLESALHQMSAFTYYSNIANMRRYSMLGGYGAIERRVEQAQYQYDTYKEKYEEFVKDASSLRAKIRGLRGWMVNTCRNLGFVIPAAFDARGDRRSQEYIDKYSDLIVEAHPNVPSLLLPKYLMNLETRTVLRIRQDLGREDPKKGAEFQNPARYDENDNRGFTGYFKNLAVVDGEGVGTCSTNAWKTEFLGCNDGPFDEGSRIQPGWGSSKLTMANTVAGTFSQQAVRDLKKDGHSVHLVFPEFFRFKFMIHTHTGLADNRRYYAPKYDLSISDEDNARRLQPYFFDLVPGFIQDPNRPGGLEPAQEYIINHYMPAIRSYITRQKEINVLIRSLILKYQDLIDDDMPAMADLNDAYESDGLNLYNLGAKYKIRAAFLRGEDININLDKLTEFDRIKSYASLPFYKSESIEAPHAGSEHFFYIDPETLLLEGGTSKPIKFVNNLLEQVEMKLHGDSEGLFAGGVESLKKRLEITIEDLTPAPITASRASLLFACFQTETVRGHRVYKHFRLRNQPPESDNDTDDTPPVFLGSSSVFEGVINKDYYSVSIDKYLDDTRDPENNIQYGLALRGYIDPEGSIPGDVDLGDEMNASYAGHGAGSSATQNLLINLNAGLLGVKSFTRFVVNQFTDPRYLNIDYREVSGYTRASFMTDQGDDMSRVERLVDPETKNSEFNNIVQEILENRDIVSSIATAINVSQGTLDRQVAPFTDGLAATTHIVTAVVNIIDHFFPALIEDHRANLNTSSYRQNLNSQLNILLAVGDDAGMGLSSYNVRAMQTENRKPYLSTSGILDWKYDKTGLYTGRTPESPNQEDKFNRTRVLAETRKFFVDNPLSGSPLNSRENQLVEDGGPRDGGRQDNLNQLVSNRIQFLSAQVQDAISKLSNNTVEKHLPLIQELFSWQNEIYSGADGDFIGGNFAQNRLALQFKAGAYEPKIFIRDRAKRGNFDRYDIAIRGDFFLGQDPSEEIKFKYCDPLPEAQLAGKLELDSGEDFTKRDAWASFLYDKIATQLNSNSRVANLSTARKNEVLRYFGNDTFMRSTVKVFEQVIFSLYRSRFFDVDYTNDLDDRISGNPIYFENCVSNKFGFSDASILSFDKVILGDPSVEIALEAARPENSPYQRDFDTPGPFEKAMKTIAVKAFIRVCLIEALLKGGIAYSSWDIESVITEPFFYDYMLNKIESELNNNSNLKGLWKSVMQKSESVSNPKEALRIFLNSELTKLPKYSKQIFNPNQPDRDFSNWALGDILPMVDTPWESNFAPEDGSKTYSFSFDDGRRGLPFCFKGQRSFHIEDYVHIRISESVKTELDSTNDNDGEPLRFWSGPATIEGFDRWFQEWFQRFDSIHETSMSIEEKRSFLERVYAGLTIEHRARLMYLEVAFDDLEGTFESGEIKNPIWKFVNEYFGPRFIYDDQSRRKRGGFVYVKRGLDGRGTKQPAFTVDLARVSRDISPRVCQGLWQVRTGVNPATGQILGFVRPEILFDLKEEKTKDYMRNLLSENDDFKFVLENVFPIKRFMSVGSVYATSLLSGYSTVPDIMKSSKEAISAIARISDTPRRFQEEMFAMNQSSFQDFLKKNFPSDPSDPSCFEFPGLGKEFFEKFFSDLWELFKSLPAILLRGIALQIDPGYKEMRSHYLNCDIKHLRTNYIAGFTVDEKLTNGLRLRPKSAKQQNKGKYASIMFSLPLDYYRSYTNPFKIHTRLYKTILKTISYIYSGNAPFIDLNSVFKIPCVDLDKNYLEDEKYDFGKYGRYGHPFSPFGLFALMTKELEMDKKMKRGKCKRNTPSIPCEDIEEETT